MLSSFQKVLVAGVAAVALSAGSAAEAYTITATIVPDGTAAPFALENFGTGDPAGPVSSAPFTTSTGVDVTFAGGSGIYAGDVSGQTRSPFRLADGTAGLDHYLNARAGGSVVLSFASSQTGFDLLWGSVDLSPANYNQLVFTFAGIGGSEIITGADVAAGLAGVVSGTTNLAVSIRGLAAFNTITVTASQEAFEFAPGVPVPAPAALAVFGLGLLGLSLARRAKRTDA